MSSPSLITRWVNTVRIALRIRYNWAVHVPKSFPCWIAFYYSDSVSSSGGYWRVFSRLLDTKQRQGIPFKFQGFQVAVPKYHIFLCYIISLVRSSCLLSILRSRDSDLEFNGTIINFQKMHRMDILIPSPRLYIAYRKHHEFRPLCLFPEQPSSISRSRPWQSLSATNRHASYNWAGPLPVAVVELFSDSWFFTTTGTSTTQSWHKSRAYVVYVVVEAATKPKFEYTHTAVSTESK